MCGYVFQLAAERRFFDAFKLSLQVFFGALMFAVQNFTYVPEDVNKIRGKATGGGGHGHSHGQSQGQSAAAPSNISEPCTTSQFEPHTLIRVCRRQGHLRVCRLWGRRKMRLTRQRHRSHRRFAEPGASPTPHTCPRRRSQWPGQLRGAPAPPGCEPGHGAGVSGSRLPRGGSRRHRPNRHAGDGADVGSEEREPRDGQVLGEYGR